MLGHYFPKYRERTVMRMTRRICILLAILIAFVSFLYVPQAQTQEKKWKKTITLPNGDKILDMNGEWDALVENYGVHAGSGSYPQIEKITQTGSSFVAIRMIADPHHPVIGSKSLEGELDESGIKKVTIFKTIGPEEAKGQISEDGNKIIIDDGESGKLTLTRK
jgi:preprotein translocase subunit YajC